MHNSNLRQPVKDAHFQDSAADRSNSVKEFVHFQVLSFVFLVLKSKCCLTVKEGMEIIYVEQDSAVDKRSSVKETNASKVAGSVW
jgi:hypothetical protein